ncbi:uncharacterized protein EV420DRAFT_1644091 [Desarmillaria tabescens]|uniref:Uncharacterized protein n=1 Tax=Armillaria tabescens TaxID=1929756 RepID=A0AA39KCI7_ARMTA|nr:uncharacterized protein EV420DRAFT_1644091 [Desarmillaria tabescens]KAK0457346.1 hypothetical protein EV420DRAFT_1644091 [Desarmillaria tabescens]
MSSLTDSGFTEEELRASLDASLNSFLFEFFVHGVYTGIYAISIQVLATNITSRTRVCMCYVNTILYVLCTIQFAAFWVELRTAFVQGTSLQSQYELMLDGAPEYLRIMRSVGSSLNIVLADCTLIWRCWVVWEHDWRVVAIPILLFASGILCGIELDIHQYRVSELIDAVQKKWAVATITMTLAVNIICTALIIARIVSVTRRQRGVIGSIRDYRGAIEILVESAALYTLSYMVLMVLYPLNGVGYMYAEMLVYPITGIAPTLIMARVASGEARPEESVHGIQSSLRFQTSSSGSSTSTVVGGFEEDMINGDSACGKYSQVEGHETSRIIEEV